jgi:hypothetical protein
MVNVENPVSVERSPPACSTSSITEGGNNEVRRRMKVCSGMATKTRRVYVATVPRSNQQMSIQTATGLQHCRVNGIEQVARRGEASAENATRQVSHRTPV